MKSDITYSGTAGDTKCCFLFSCTGVAKRSTVLKVKSDLTYSGTAGDKKCCFLFSCTGVAKRRTVLKVFNSFVNSLVKE